MLAVTARTSSAAHPCNLHRSSLQLPVASIPSSSFSLDYDIRVRRSQWSRGVGGREATELFVTCRSLSPPPSPLPSYLYVCVVVLCSILCLFRILQLQLPTRLSSSSLSSQSTRSNDTHRHSLAHSRTLTTHTPVQHTHTHSIHARRDDNSATNTQRSDNGCSLLIFTPHSSSLPLLQFESQRKSIILLVPSSLAAECISSPPSPILV